MSACRSRSTRRGPSRPSKPFALAGWAADLDAASGTGINTLHVSAYPSTGGLPVFLGTPALGGLRPDVAAVHGDQFIESGFGLTVQGLNGGTYDLAVFPWSNVTGAFAPPNVVHVTVHRIGANRMAGVARAGRRRQGQNRSRRRPTFRPDLVREWAHRSTGSERVDL